METGQHAALQLPLHTLAAAAFVASSFLRAAVAWASCSSSACTQQPKQMHRLSCCICITVREKNCRKCKLCVCTLAPACLPPLLVCLASDGDRVRLQNLHPAGREPPQHFQRPHAALPQYNSMWFPSNKQQAPLAHRAARLLAAARLHMRTLPRHASLNLVPLPQPRGQGKPILRFLQNAAPRQ